jgi:vacuolar-type H+-ATPase subunit F/Vma7
MLRWLKTVVVSDEEKAHRMRQVGARKTIIAEVPKLARTTSKPGCRWNPGMSLAGVR